MCLTLTLKDATVTWAIMTYESTSDWSTVPNKKLNRLSKGSRDL